MTWARFGYICRKASYDHKGNESIAMRLSRIENESSCRIYGEEFSPNSLPHQILRRIGNTESDKKAQAALEVYRDLNFSKNFEEPMRFKRVVAYLSYVTFTFYVVVGIYQLKVAPSFLDAFENFDIQIPKHLTLYQDYWGHFVLIVSVLLISSLLIGFQLRKLFKFETGREKNWIVRFLVFPAIRRSYLKIINILQYPITGITDYKDLEIKRVMKHLDDINKSNMCMSREIQELIEIEMQVLLDNCEKQMKYISITVAMIIISAVFLFLASAYSPIFVLGETV